MIDMVRENGLGHYKTILMEVAKNPAMIYWLDNNDNHADSINENWGRELLELFSMGIGNYTEDEYKKMYEWYDMEDYIDALESINFNEDSETSLLLPDGGFMIEFTPDEKMKKIDYLKRLAILMMLAYLLTF